LYIDAKVPAYENFHDFTFHLDQIVSRHSNHLFLRNFLPHAWSKKFRRNVRTSDSLPPTGSGQPLLAPVPASLLDGMKIIVDTQPPCVHGSCASKLERGRSLVANRFSISPSERADLSSHHEDRHEGTPGRTRKCSCTRVP